MKKHAILVILFCLPSTLADALPPEAKKLKESHLQARQRAVEPLDRQYREELSKLMESYTKDGLLDEALAVRREIGLAEALHDRDTAELPITKALWQWSPGYHLAFFSDGTAVIGRHKGPATRYTWNKTTGAREISLVGESWPDEGKTFKIAFSQDFTKAEVSFERHRSTLSRLP